MTTREAAQGAGAEPPQAAWAGLVGRSDVLAQLGRAVADAAGGRGRLVLLTGEAGIGKTSVAAQAAADAEGPAPGWCGGGAWQGEGAPAYWPWVQVLRSLLARDRRLQRLAADAPSLARLLPELPGATAPPAAADEPATARFRLLDEVTAVLLAAAEDRPLVVILEDLQWADPPSLQLLDFLARRLPAARALVLATYRDLDTAPDDPAAPLLADLAARATVPPAGAVRGRGGPAGRRHARRPAGTGPGRRPAPADRRQPVLRPAGHPAAGGPRPAAPGGRGGACRPGSPLASARPSGGAWPGSARPVPSWSPRPPWPGRNAPPPSSPGSPARPPKPCATCWRRPSGPTS